MTDPDNRDSPTEEREEQHPLEAIAERAKALREKHGKSAAPLGILSLVGLLIVGILIGTLGWAVLPFALAFAIPLLLVIRNLRKRAVLARAQGAAQAEEKAPRRPLLTAVGIFFGILTIPIAVQALWSYWNTWYETDWDRTFHRPTIYYVWKVDETIFTDDLAKARVMSINPKPESNSAIRESLKMAALHMGIAVDRVRPFEEAYVKPNETYTIIMFESISEPAWVLQPVQAAEEAEDEDAKEEAEGEMPPPMEKVQVLVPRLMVHFRVNISGEEAAEMFDKDGKLKATDVRGKLVPDTLEVTFPFLVNGFAQAMGKDPNMVIDQIPSAFPPGNLSEGPKGG